MSVLHYLLSASTLEASHSVRKSADQYKKRTNNSRTNGRCKFQRFLVLLLLPLVAAAAMLTLFSMPKTKNSEPHIVPLNEYHLNTSLPELYHKYSRQRNLDPPAQEITDFMFGAEKIDHFHDSGAYDIRYYGEIVIEKQAFPVILDTGSSFTWILYNGDQFEKHNESFVVVEPAGEGYVAGHVVQENVSFAGFSAIARFGAVNSADQATQAESTHGVLGMAYRTLPDSRDHVQPLLQKLGISQFAFDLNRNELHLGGYDTNYSSSMFWAHVKKSSYFDVELRAITVNETRVNVASSTARLVTGTALLIGPMDEFWNLFAGGEGAYDPNTGRLKQDCRLLSMLNDIHIVLFDGVDQCATFVLQPSDYVLKVDNECYLGIRCDPYIDFWILGNMFLRKSYTVFDTERDRVGFSPFRDDKSNDTFESTCKSNAESGPHPYHKTPIWVWISLALLAILSVGLAALVIFYRRKYHRARAAQRPGG